MDPIHSIVLALTPNEKRYFKMFAKTFKSSSQVMRLFEELNKMNAYDEAVLVKKTGIRNLIPVKISLRKILFRAMRNYREDVDIQQQLRDDISNIEFLVRKNLMEEAAKEIRKAIKIAEKGEVYSSLSELLVYSALAASNDIKREDIRGHFLSILSHMGETVQLQGEVQRALLYQRYMTFTMRKGNYESPDELSDKMLSISAEAEHLLASTHSHFAKICLLVTMAAHHGADNSLVIYQQIHKLYKHEPHNIEKHTHLYFSFLTNYITLTANRKEMARIALPLFEEIERGFITYKNYFKYYPDKLPYFNYRLIGNKLGYCKLNNDWREMDALSEGVKEALIHKAFRKDIIGAMVLGQLTGALLDRKKYSECLDWIHKYYALPSSKLVKLLMICVRFQECICFNQLGNYDLSEVKAKNLIKTIAEQDLTDDYHKLICALLRRLNHWVVDDKNRQNEIAEFKKKFEKMRDEEHSHYVVYSAFLEPDKVLGQLSMK